VAALLEYVGNGPKGSAVKKAIVLEQEINGLLNGCDD
jgi:hypothetical protein